MTGERFTRGRLPHWFVPDAFTFVTYRLAATIPLSVINELERKRERLFAAPPRDGDLAAHRHRINKIVFADYDASLDITLPSIGFAILILPR